MKKTGDNDQGFTSRYAIKKALGNFAPWQGYGVTDSLSGRDYLLFSLISPSGTTLSVDDLLMRDSVFSGFASKQTRSLSIQESGGGIFFLLPWQKIVPVTKMLPSLGTGECIALTRRFASVALEALLSGRFFHNLSIESLIISGRSIGILPSAYLIPGTVLERMEPGGRARGGGRGALCSELNDTGEILSVFCRYLPGDISSRCAGLVEDLREAAPETGTDSIYAIVDSLAGFCEYSDPLPSILPGMEPSFRNPAEAMELLRKAALSAKDGSSRLVLLYGKRGEGKTTLLENAAERLSTEWGLEGGGVIGDQDIFADFEDRGEDGAVDYVIFDDHNDDPILLGYIVDRLSHDLDRTSLAVVPIGEDPPPWLTSALEAEARDKGFEVDEIHLSPFEGEARKKIILDSIRPGDRASFEKAAETSVPLAQAQAEVRLAASRKDRPGGAEGILDSLTGEERSVLNFIAAFRFEVPLSVLKGVFSTEEGRYYGILQRLVSLGLIRARALESCFTGDALCTVYSIAGRTISDLVEESMPPARRRELHRNIAQILKEDGEVPSAYIYYQLAMCGDLEEAAFRGLRSFKLLLGRKRLNAIKCFNEGFMGMKLDRHLPVEMRLQLLLELGDFFSLIGNIEKAEELFRKCREETRQGDEPHSHRALTVESIRKECEILEKRGDFTRAEKVLRKALSQHGEHIQARERARLYNDLAWVYYRLGRFDKSWENCLLVHKLLDRKQHPVELAESYSLMGAINWNRSRYDEALLCHKRCLALREDSNDELGVAASLNNLGLVYRSMGRFKEALESFTKSMKIKQSNSNLPGLAAVHLNIALAYLDMDELEKAETNCTTAIGLAEDLGNQQLLAEVCGTLGEIHFRKGDHSSARDHYYRDLHLCGKTRSLKEKAVVLRRLGELGLAEGSVEETKGLLEEARKLNGKIGSLLETSLLDLLEARIHLSEGKRDQGRRKLEETSFELSLLGRKGIAAAVAAEIGELYLEEGNEPLAREYLLRAISLGGESEKMPRQLLELQEHLEQKISFDMNKIHSDSARFRALCRVVSLIRTIQDPEKLYMTITDAARKITSMERAALILQSDGRDTYRILASLGQFDSEAILTDKNIIAVLNITRQLGYPLDISRTRIPGGKVSEEFLRDYPGIICTPLWIRDEVTGYLYLDSTRSTAGATDEDHTFLVAFSQQVALGLERIILQDRVKQLEKTEPPAQAAMTSPRERVTFQDIVGKSPAIRHIYELIDGIKDMDTIVLLTGPNGSGKDLVAKTIHYTSPRRDQTFHTLNCAAFPRELIESELFGYEKGAFTGAYKQKIGHFESARNGTIFLDEIGELPLSLQPKLLRVLEHRKFFRVGGTNEIETGARIICATNRDLMKLVKENRFREDLYYRINIFPIRVPGLSERREDIKLLCNHFLTTYCRLYNTPTKRISPEAMALLTSYDWPGNVRELENTINRLIIISRKDTILPEDLPANIVKHRESVETRSLNTLEDLVDSILDNMELSSSEPILPRVKETLIAKVVEKTGDKTQAAKMLGISKPTLYNHLRNHERNLENS